MSQPPGRYWAQGDPPNTTRYWNGAAWEGAPVPVTSAIPAQVGPGGLGPFGGYPEKSQATALLIVSILGFLVCQLASPVSWYLARKELEAIDAGRRDPKDRGTAKAAMIIGIIGTVLTILAIVAYVVLIIFLLTNAETYN